MARQDLRTSTEQDAGRFARSQVEPGDGQELADVHGITALHPRTLAWINGEISFEDILRAAGAER